MDNNIGVERYHIRDLMQDVNNIVLIAIVIGKRQPRSFTKDNVTKAVWNCTIRDSPFDYINVTYWGTEDVILPLYEKFQIGDIIEVIKPKVFLRRIQDVGEQYEPNVTSPFKLVLGDQSQIIRHETNAFDKLHSLMRIPTKPLITFITLNDIQNYESVKDEYLNLLVAIRTVCDIRYVTLRSGFQQQVRDVIVFDHTYPNFKLSLWDPEMITRASFWQPRTTILFMVDMKVLWNNFFKCTTGTITSKTIITENPIGNEADMLKQFALLAPLEASSILEKMTTTLPDPATIQNVMSIERIVTKINIIINATNLDAEEQKFTALVYAVVTDFDLDGMTRVITNKCFSCKKYIDRTKENCDDPMCPMGCGDERPEVESTFDIKVTLSDHTGTLTKCRLTGATAESVLRCKVTEFLTMSDERKYRLKWRYLLERCAVRLFILCLQGRDPIISILSCEVASPLEATNKIPLC